jgi:hypothetical protein
MGNFFFLFQHKTLTVCMIDPEGHQKTHLSNVASVDSEIGTPDCTRGKRIVDEDDPVAGDPGSFPVQPDSNIVRKESCRRDRDPIRDPSGNDHSSLSLNRKTGKKVKTIKISNTEEAKRVKKDAAR